MEDHWSFRDTIAYTLVYEGDVTTYTGIIGAGTDIVLTGRDSDWAQESHTMAGAYLRARHKFNCVDFNGFLLPNTSCSSGWRTSSATSYQRNFLTSFGTYHNDNTVYWYDYRFDWEHPEFPDTTNDLQYPPEGQNLTSDKFECKVGTNPVCHFLAPESPASEIW